MGLEVIGTGFGRTGTLSLRTALETLGFGPCHHMTDVYASPARSRHWVARARGARLDDRAFAGFRSTVDWPASAIWRDLAERHPDARFVHTIRDPQRWWVSTAETIATVSDALAPWAQRAVPHLGRMIELSDRLIWEGIFDGRFADREFAIECFERHTADVVAAIPADRLLVFEVAQGWEPLCAFLDVDVPTTPFPHVNDAASMKRKIGLMRTASSGLPWLGAGIAAAVLAGLTRRR